MVSFTSCLFFCFDSDSLRFLFKVPSVKNRCLRVCVGLCVCILLLLVVHVCAFWNESVWSDWGGPTVCWFLSASCWNETRCCVQPIWTDEITHKLPCKHTPPSPPPRWGLWALILIWSGRNEPRACLFLIKIKLVILLVAFISIHCLNFQQANWIGSRTKRVRCIGEHRTKNKDM